MARALAVVLVLCVVAGVARAGHGPKVTPVEKLAAEAAGAYRAGDFAKAAELLERAYQIEPLSAILYNLAKAYEKLGQSEKAADRYARYAAAADADPKLKAKAEAHAASLRGAKEPKPVMGENVPPPTTPTTNAPPPPATVEAPPPPPPAPPPPPVDERQVAWKHTLRRDRAAAIGFAITATVGLAIAVGLSANALSLHNQFSASLDEDKKRSLEDSAKSQAIGADIMYAFTVAAAAGSVVFFYLYFRAKRSPPPSQAFVPLLAPGRAGLAWELRF